ncbi:MAG: hypothetical protein A3J97_06155 [Spirochaetes bacterium RIFOXYC1_FULL_54_7]|nr:MAG: hypothetical protein A3J97_06155 [Spirochaetes bacterium RIFOXYC1_FULL_54_7]
MKRMVILACTILVTLSLGADPALKEVLHVYDEVNDNSKPYLGYFGEVYANQGIDHYQVTVAELEAVDLERYDTIVIHAMVMAFNMKSPVRDWLKTKPPLAGKKTYLFVTANRWYLDRLYGQLTSLLEGNTELDAVSMATKDLDETSKRAVVQALAARIK